MMEILAVTAPSVGDSALRGAAVDRPRRGSIDVHALDIEGWALGRDLDVVAVEALVGDGEPAPFQFGVPRPDLQDAFPGAPGAASSGFRGALGPLELPLRFTIRVRAVLADGSRSTFAEIAGRRDPLRSRIRPHLHPIALTCIGRTGGNWVAHLLAQHPEVVAYRPFEYDLRAAQYWVELLRTVARPASYLCSLAPGATSSDWWIGTDAGVVPFAAEEDLARWFHGEHIETMADFCHDRIDRFYVELAARQGRPDARRFVERFYAAHQSAATLVELDPETRQVVLVRDFRDVLCSVLAFNAKRSFDAFGRDMFDSDADYVGHMAERARYLLAAWKDAAHPVELLRYEDLVRDPEASLRRVLDFVGVDASSTSVQRVLEAAACETPSMSFHRTTPSASASVGRWRHDLDPSLRELCEQEVGPIMSEFGYALDS
jgi:hypothetical protein